MKELCGLKLIVVVVLLWGCGAGWAAYLEGLLCQDPLPWPGRLARCAIGPATGGAWAAPAVGDITGDQVVDLVVGSAYGDVLLYEGRADGVFGPPRLLLIGDVPEPTPVLQPAVPCLIRPRYDLLVLRGGRLLRYRRVTEGFTAGREVTGPGGARLAEVLARAGGSAPASVAVSAANELFLADAAGRLWRGVLERAEGIGELSPLKNDHSVQLAFPPPVSIAVGDLGGGGQEDLVIGAAGALYVCAVSAGQASAAQELAREVRTKEGVAAERIAPAIERPGTLIVGTRWGLLLRCRVEKGQLTAVEPIQAHEVPLDCGLYAAPTALDWDGDGRLDLVVAGADGLLRLFLARPDGLFEAPALLSDTTGPIHLPGNHGYAAGFPAFADLNGDRRLELLVGCADGYTRIFRNEGRLVAANPLSVGGEEVVCDGIPTPEPVDWDHDGDTDLILGVQPRPVSDAGEVAASALSPIQFLENQAPPGAWCKYEKVVPIDMAARWQGVDGEGSYILPWQLRMPARLGRDSAPLVLGASGVYVFRLATLAPAYPRVVAGAEDGLLRAWRVRGPAWGICRFGDKVAVGLGPYGFVTMAEMPGQ